MNARGVGRRWLPRSRSGPAIGPVHLRADDAASDPPGGHGAAGSRHPESAAAARSVPSRDAQGRRPAQPPVRVDLRRELHPVGGRGQPVSSSTATLTLVTGTCDAAAGRPSGDGGAPGLGALQRDHRRLVHAQLAGGPQRPRSLLRGVRQVQPRDRSRVGDMLAEMTARAAVGKRQLPRADADARRRRGDTPRPRSWSGTRTSRRCGLGCSGRTSATCFTQTRQRLDCG